ncbi:putative quinol monooxygenase, partial [Prauserella aidingensis]|uniref:putative quinol monooxygenase n=1 Tax=Prauserella aidingensis TaxID=387890 RepID=UPI0020A61937
ETSPTRGSPPHLSASMPQISCASYYLAEITSFCVDDAATGTVTVLEEWDSHEALDRHLSEPEVVAVFTKWGPRMDNKVRKFDAHNERDPRS